ncbi:Lysosomal amino acid transporter 1 [Taenia crassiceps]|uniref:Lysosomal amino acid transporter 1 n=1 Tax=Taenia crassiceps TaxID=6207 RepID=A0ABR4QG14_9CEST
MSLRRRSFGFNSFACSCMAFPGTLFLIRGEPTPIDANCTDGIQWIWIVFRQCAVSSQEIVAVTFGLLSTIIWVVFAVPQIVENCRKVGDTVNLIGCICVHQLPLQIVMAAIGILGDLIQILQFLYCKFKHKLVSQDFATSIEVPPPNNSGYDGVIDHSTRLSSSSALSVVCPLGILCLTGPVWSAGCYDHGSPSIFRRLLAYESTSAHGLRFESLFPTSSLIVGYVLGWISASIYISSRIPQILKNRQRSSTEGLSPVTFIFAIVGNVAYALQIFLTSIEFTFIIRALPWLFGSLGVVLFDLIICAQFCRYHGRGYFSLEEDVEVTTC